VNSYLTMAAKVLEEARMPLSARQILTRAYERQLVPDDLFGKTQHKTLHARLAVDILRSPERSEFVRTSPGRFLLRRQLYDTSVPQRLRREFRAPLRANQLRKFDVLCVPYQALLALKARDGEFPLLAHFPIRNARFHRFSRVNELASSTYVRLLVVLCRNGQVLVSRAGEADREGLDSQMSLGILGFIRREDRTLFSSETLGVSDAAWRTIHEHLRLPPSLEDVLSSAIDARKLHCVFGFGADHAHPTLAIVAPIRVPALADLDQAIASVTRFEWCDRPAGINNLDRLDPWSRSLVEGGRLDAVMC